MKIIKIDGCFKVVLPDITMRNTSGHVLDRVHCPYLFQHIIKYYCTLINQKHRVYRSYGDMKKMFADCPLDDLVEAEVMIARPEDQLKGLLNQYKEHC